MKNFIKLFGFGFIMVFSVNCFAVSEQQAQNMFNNILKANGLKNYPKLIVDPSLSPNAWTTPDNKQVTITRGSLQMFNTQEIAGSLGHEIAHNIIGADEGKSDVLGAELAAKAGYDKCEARYRFKKYFSLGGPQTNPTDPHPDDRERFKSLSAGCPYEDPYLWKFNSK